MWLRLSADDPGDKNSTNDAWCPRSFMNPKVTATLSADTGIFVISLCTHKAKIIT